MTRFSLGQMLAFVLGCCVFLAALRGFSMWPLGISPRWPATTWHSFVVQLGAWAALLVLFSDWRLTPSMVVHLATPGIIVLISLASAGDFFQTIEAGCTLGTLGSFPLAMATISVRRFKAGSRADQ